MSNMYNFFCLVYLCPQDGNLLNKLIEHKRGWSDFVAQISLYFQEILYEMCNLKWKLYFWSHTCTHLNLFIYTLRPKFFGRSLKFRLFKNSSLIVIVVLSFQIALQNLKFEFGYNMTYSWTLEKDINNNVDFGKMTKVLGHSKRESITLSVGRGIKCYIRYMYPLHITYLDMFSYVNLFDLAC